MAKATRRKSAETGEAALKKEIARLRKQNEVLEARQSGGMTMFTEESSDKKRLLINVSNGGRATRFGLKKAQHILENVEDFAGLVAKLERDEKRRRAEK